MVNNRVPTTASCPRGPRGRRARNRATRAIKSASAALIQHQSTAACRVPPCRNRARATTHRAPLIASCPIGRSTRRASHGAATPCCRCVRATPRRGRSCKARNSAESRAPSCKARNCAPPSRATFTRRTRAASRTATPPENSAPARTLPRSREPWPSTGAVRTRCRAPSTPSTKTCGRPSRMRARGTTSCTTR